MSNSVPDNAPKPRLCHIKKWADFNGYGFNLHAEKGKAGQYIGKVDPGSPAEAAGLKQSDKIIEVNGTNIGNENHQQVVQRIKAVPNETKLLVVDKEAEDYFASEKIVVRGDMPYVQSIACPDEKGGEVVTSTPNDLPAAPAAVSDDSAPKDEEEGPSPRLCHLKLWPDFQGYGFNLHEEENKKGQFVGKVDEGSPAEAAGLLPGDVLVEVNGKALMDAGHKKVVEEVKADPSQVRLLVVDEATFDYYDKKNETISGDMKNVKTITCPDSKGATKEEEKKEEVKEEVKEEPIEVKVEEKNGISADAPAPRQCHLVIWPDFQGYGFNLHAEKGKPGQFIGKVDPGSPSEAAGLRQGDRIVEVNGINIADDNHGQVVQKIKQDATRTTMLVVDEEAEQYYRAKGLVVSSSMANVVDIQCPETRVVTAEPVVEVAAAPKEEGPSPRLCHLKIWSDFQGYGFNLHAEKGKGGQYIGKVDDGSPAEAAGLKSGDKIVEVNGQSVGNESHQEVVKAIKSDASQVKLLVVDPPTFDYYAEKNVAVTGSMSNVKTITCPDSKPIANGSAALSAAAGAAEEESSSVHSAQINGAVSTEEDEAPPTPPSQEQAEPAEEEVQVQEEVQAQVQEEVQVQQPALEEAVEEAAPEPEVCPEEQPEPEPEPAPEPEVEAAKVDENENEAVAEVNNEGAAEAVAAMEDTIREAEQQDVQEAEAAKQEPTSPVSPSGPVTVAGIEFAASASEARARVSRRSRDKHGVKKAEGISMRDKYELFQKL